MRRFQVFLKDWNRLLLYNALYTKRKPDCTRRELSPTEK